MLSREADEIIQGMGTEWKKTCVTLENHEQAIFETYIRFLRSVAQTCLRKGWRVWFRPNRVVHWGEGGFGWLSVLLPPGEGVDLRHLPTEICFMTDLTGKDSLGDEITLETLDRIMYVPDPWVWA